MNGGEVPSSADEVSAQRWTRVRVARALLADPERGVELSPVSTRGWVAGPLVAVVVAAVLGWEPQIRAWLVSLTG